MPLYDIKPNTDRARNIPVYYSDKWDVLASAKKTYNIPVPPTRSRFGPYRWIKVHHGQSDDYLTVMRLWKDSANGSKPTAEILKGAENDAIISQGGDYWRVLTGEGDTLKGNLALMRWRNATVAAGDAKKDIDARLAALQPDELMIVDATYASIAGDKYTFDHPATLSFDRTKGTGSIAVLESGQARLTWRVREVTMDGVKIPSGNYLTARNSSCPRESTRSRSTRTPSR